MNDLREWVGSAQKQADVAAVWGARGGNNHEFSDYGLAVA